MAAEIPDVVPDELIESAWGNQIRDRSVQRFASRAALDQWTPGVNSGALAYTADTGSLWMMGPSGWFTVTRAQPGSGVIVVRILAATTDAYGNVGFAAPAGMIVQVAWAMSAQRDWRWIIALNNADAPLPAAGATFLVGRPSDGQGVGSTAVSLVVGMYCTF